MTTRTNESFITSHLNDCADPQGNLPMSIEFHEETIHYLQLKRDSRALEDQLVGLIEQYPNHPAILPIVADAYVWLLVEGRIKHNFLNRNLDSVMPENSKLRPLLEETFNMYRSLQGRLENRELLDELYDFVSKQVYDVTSHAAYDHS